MKTVWLGDLAPFRVSRVVHLAEARRRLREGDSGGQGADNDARGEGGESDVSKISNDELYKRLMKHLDLADENGGRFGPKLRGSYMELVQEYQRRNRPTQEAEKEDDDDDDKHPILKNPQLGYRDRPASEARRRATNANEFLEAIRGERSSVSARPTPEAKVSGEELSKGAAAFLKAIRS